MPQARSHEKDEKYYRPFSKTLIKVKKSLQGEVKTAPDLPYESTFKDKGEAFLNRKNCFHLC